MEELEQRRRDFAELLRAARHRLTHDDVGLPRPLRARSCGLRRSDVAELAGISETYYAWLEQGRVESPSVTVLTKIANALRLHDGERVELVRLAQNEGPESRRSAAFINRAMRELGKQIRTWHTCCDVQQGVVEALHRPDYTSYFVEIVGQLATVVAARGDNTDYAVGLSSTLDELTPYLASYRQREAASDIDVSQSRGSWGEIARQRDLRSFLAVPLFVEDRLVAAFGYAQAEARSHGSIEIDALLAMASMIEVVLPEICARKQEQRFLA